MPPSLKTPTTETPDAKTRVQLDLAPAQIERLNWLMEACALDTRKELFNTALSLFEWAVIEARKGRTVASIDKGAKHIAELAMPALSDAVRNATRVKAIAA